MTNTTKHEKLIHQAGTERGASTSLYMNEARELIAAGILEAREVFTKVGARKLQLFLKAA
jgi:hypothetical protein